ncbi:vanadium-dependent haloperoxidase [Crocosphaera sp. UHCC 0190]|uniref:vanadium-dependent haloperoxidase n=1 Tax=Crocosphaera sp. UHCC 0190 TaxID=3110246 RepID=UPI002B1EFC54|nr:vanadium-dependent haloperoxidase [Crocosphaera sp. UHCC 0190]MEA5509482.1 vanadium-dependent haloperoxidase [Crocosphaera sp. UHCC 0190]
MDDRRIEALRIRRDAAEVASERPHPLHISNGEEFRYRNSENKPTHLANYSKGLPHCEKTGVIVNAEDYQQFVRGIDSGDVRDFRDTPLGPPNQDGVPFPKWQSHIAQTSKGCKVPVRAWESAGAGSTFDLQGPDSQSLTMPPAPELDSEELITEMIEIYGMALLRDVPFANFNSSTEVQKVVDLLNQSPWIKNQATNYIHLTDAEQKRLRGPFTKQTVFRGIAPGDNVGPYLSQFLLVGNQGLENIQSLSDGYIAYGAIRVDQRIRVAEPLKDYMTTWEAWVDVQNGADLRGIETYSETPAPYRFMATPRDLATYVHYDALYEAYLNACLIMLGLKIPFDPGIPFQGADFKDKQQGFAQFGGPHILSLVTEVATRALKAVRFQKFNVHRRLRPEAVSGWVTRYVNDDTKGIEAIKPLVDGLGEGLLKAVADHNCKQNQKFSDRTSDANNCYKASYLLPMAFPEGSPMHPAYGAGHATVAGACVTILKAFFDAGATLNFAFQPSADGSKLEPVTLDKPLTVEGELNKIAANIAIGRNWAGVHYFTDYIESLRLGEQVAIGILQEQKLTYGENFSMTIPLFDGGSIRI